MSLSLTLSHTEASLCRPSAAWSWDRKWLSFNQGAGMSFPPVFALHTSCFPLLSPDWWTLIFWKLHPEKMTSKVTMKTLKIFSLRALFLSASLLNCFFVTFPPLPASPRVSDVVSSPRLYCHVKCLSWEALLHHHSLLFLRSLCSTLLLIHASFLPQALHCHPLLCPSLPLTLTAG